MENYIYESSIKIMKDKFILKLRDSDLVSYLDSEKNAAACALAQYDRLLKEPDSRCLQSWTPENVTTFVKDGKAYTFYGFQFEVGGEVQPRYFFLFETTD